MEKMFIWAGHYTRSAEDFDKLFDLSSFYEGYNKGEFIRCAFAEYIDEDSYDQDLIGWYYENSLNDILKQMPEEQLHEKIKSSINKLNLSNTNSLIYYCDEEADISGEDFEGLKFIGEFSIEE